MYTNYSKMGVTPDPEEQALEITGAFSRIEPEVEPEVEPETPDMLLGVVTGCPKLNVRAEANSDADVLTTLPSDTEVMIDTEASTDDFYKVCTASGLEGYCMKKYITVQ